MVRNQRFSRTFLQIPFPFLQTSGESESCNPQLRGACSKHSSRSPILAGVRDNAILTLPCWQQLFVQLCAALAALSQSLSGLRTQEPKTWHWLGFKRRPPCANCFADLLKIISVDEFERVIREWTRQLPGIELDDHTLSAVSIDGKTLCGTLQQHQRTIHLIAALDHQTGYVLSQAQVDPETNEAKAALQFLKTLVLRGKSLSATRCSASETSANKYSIPAAITLSSSKRTSRRC